MGVLDRSIEARPCAYRGLFLCDKPPRAIDARLTSVVASSSPRARPRARHRSQNNTAELTGLTLPLSTFPLQALFDLEATNNELKAELKDLYINGAQEIDVAGGRTAVAIQVPFRLLKAFHKIQQRLVRELEKKFSGKDVVIVANRRINPVPKAASPARAPEAAP